MKPVYLTGHSLGGALAYLIGGMMMLDKMPPAGITVFAPASPATSVLGYLLANIPGQAYRCGNDEVPDVPLWPFGQPRKLINFGAAKLDPAECHFMTNFIGAEEIGKHSTGPFADSELAALCEASYRQPPAFQIADWIDHVCVAALVRDDAVALALRGTVPKDVRTIIEDLRFMPGMDYHHFGLGPVPHGFLGAAEKIYPLITHWLAGA